VIARRVSTCVPLVVFAIRCFEPKPPDVIVLTLESEVTLAEPLRDRGYADPPP